MPHPLPSLPPRLEARTVLVAAFGLLTLSLIFSAKPATAQEELLVVHPRLFDFTGTTVREASVEVLDPDDPSTPVRRRNLGTSLPMGIGHDPGGDLFFGNVTFDPLRVELLRLDPQGGFDSYGTTVDSSIRGFIDFIGFDFAMRGRDAYFVQGREYDQDLRPTDGFRIERMDLDTGRREELLEVEEDVSGLAVDESGTIYFGVLTYEPLRVELRRLGTDGVVSSLGTVFDSIGGFTFARPFQLAVGGGSLYFVHGRVERGDGSILEQERLERLDLATGARTVLRTQGGDELLDGLAVDSQGRVFVGVASFDPLRLEVLRIAPDGSTDSYGTVVDTSIGLAQFLRSYLAVTAPPSLQTCRRDGGTLCLGVDGRFQLRGTWRSAEGTGTMGATDLGKQDSGAFHFFRPDNLEVLIKVLDACDASGHHWVFFSATTDVEFELTVTDTRTGDERTYRNALGQAADPVLDTTAFACDG